jgi:hypothetical protein
MAYDKTRNNVDDPILHAPLRTGAPAKPAGGANAFGPQSGAPVLVARDPGDYPVGGQAVTVSAQVNATQHPWTSADAMTTVLQWQAKDGNSRRGFVTLVPSNPKRAMADRINVAAWCRITMGSARGSISFWAMAPAIVPVQGTYLRVDALLARAGNQLAYGGTLPSGPIIPVIPAVPLSWDLSANFFDEDSDRFPDPTILGPSLVPCTQAAAAQWDAPAIIDSIELTNTNAAAGVYIVIGDSTITTGPAFVPGEDVGIVFVPAGSTVSVGRELLGSFSNGVTLFGTTTFSGAFTDDPNDANVFATIRGLYLQPG